MTQRFTNNATSRLASPIADSDTTLTLASGGGDVFPDTAGGVTFKVDLISSTAREIILVSSRTGDVFDTIVRAQEGTTAIAFAAADTVELRLTALFLNDLVDSVAAKLVKASNLSDLASASTARTNLGLGTAATQASSAFLQPSNNLSDVSSASTARTNLGVDAAIAAAVAGLSWKQAVRAATTANGTLATAFANGQTIDGVTLVTGDRILLKDQSSASANGIYIVAASGAPSRATDADSGAELVNASCYVSEGTTNADTQWTCTTNATITVGSTSIAFAQLTSGGSVTDASISTSDITTNNASTSKHGFQKKLNGDATTFADGNGGYTKPMLPYPVAISDETTALTTGTAKVTFRIPYACTMTALPRANVNAVSSSGLPTFDVKKNGTTIFSTTLTIDASEKTSTTAATPAVLSGGSTTFADDDEVTIDISTAGTGTKGAKLTFYLIPT